MADDLTPEQLAEAEAQAAAEAEAQATAAKRAAAPKGVYATVHLTHAGRVYEPGDEVTHLPPFVKKDILELGHASPAKPKVPRA